MNVHDLREFTDLATKLTGSAGTMARAFVDRATVQLETPGLRVGVATEGGRPIGEVLATIDGLGLYRDVWSFSGDERPGGADVWVLILTADQHGSQAERDFIESLGPGMAKQCIVMVTRMERIPPERVSDVRSRTEELFLPLGVPAEQLLHGAADLGQLRKRLERWWAHREDVRERSVSSYAQPMLDELSLEESALISRLGSLPDVADAETTREGFHREAIELLGAIRRQGEASIDALPNKVSDAWERFIEMLQQEKKLDQTRFEAALSSWLQDGFVRPFEEELMAALERATRAPQLASLFATADVMGAASFETPSVKMPKRKRRGRFLKAILPVMGGAVGFVRGGPRFALAGSAAGMIAARALGKRGRARFADKKTMGAVTAHLTAHYGAALSTLIDRLQTQIDEKAERLSMDVGRAHDAANDRDELQDSLTAIRRALTMVRGLAG